MFLSGRYPRLADVLCCRRVPGIDSDQDGPTFSCCFQKFRFALNCRWCNPPTFNSIADVSDVEAPTFDSISDVTCRLCPTFNVISAVVVDITVGYVGTSSDTSMGDSHSPTCTLGLIPLPLLPCPPQWALYCVFGHSWRVTRWVWAVFRVCLCPVGFWAGCWKLLLLLICVCISLLLLYLNGGLCSCCYLDGSSTVDLRSCRVPTTCPNITAPHLKAA